jgi:hypothetical protein
MFFATLKWKISLKKPHLLKMYTLLISRYIQQEAIIVFREKLKTPFRINPIWNIRYT